MRSIVSYCREPQAAQRTGSLKTLQVSAMEKI
jgi:hypothetical protein